MNILEPGFYLSESGERRYWDGTQWLKPDLGVTGDTGAEGHTQVNKANSKKKPVVAALVTIGVLVGLWLVVQTGNTLYSTQDNVGTQEPGQVSNETIGESNARKKADQYISTMPFSKAGLIKQLKFEGFSEADAQYAVSVIVVDWNEQAAKKARQYLDTMAFSRDGLVRQLDFEGFSAAEVEYGVTSVGY